MCHQNRAVLRRPKNGDQVGSLNLSNVYLSAHPPVLALPSTAVCDGVC